MNTILLTHEQMTKNKTKANTHISETIFLTKKNVIPKQQHKTNQKQYFQR